MERAWAGVPGRGSLPAEPFPMFFALKQGLYVREMGPALGMKMAELITQRAVSELSGDEIHLARFQSERRSKNAIALPFPTE